MSPTEGRIVFPDADASSKAIQKAMMPTAVGIVKQRALELVPRRTGKLAQKIESRIEQGGQQGIVAARGRYAHLVHQGTKRHAIKHRKKKALRIRSGGLLFIRAQVREHPGQRGQPFLTDALEDSRAQVEAVLGRDGEKFLREALE
jgi:HK97 gp10 family phage protein